MFVLRILSAVALLCDSSLSSPVSFSVDWSSFLGRADPLWAWTNTSAQPDEWVDGLFGGNGAQGFLLWQPSPGTLRLDIGRTDVYDDRVSALNAGGACNATRCPYIGNFALDQPRLPLGHLLIELDTPIIEATGRTILWDARSEISLTTLAGTQLTVAAWACAAWQDGDALVVEVRAIGGGSLPRISYVPEPAVSTWAGGEKRYVFNPEPALASTVVGAGVTLNTTTQSHLVGTAHATAVVDDASSPGARTLFIATSAVLSSPAAASAAAAGAATAAQAAGAALRAAHEAWWHNWWPAGGAVTLDFSKFESFFYIQLFKFGSAVRADRGIVHDLMGPWYIDGTNWPDLHWDLNLQQTYWLPVLANRPDLSATLHAFLTAIATSGAFTTNVPPAWQADSAAAPTGASSLQANETCYWSYGANCTTSPPSVTGNLLWTLQVARAATVAVPSAATDVGLLWPLLGRAVNFYLHFAIDTDGALHLPPTFSPEYPGPPGPDANFDLALLRWGLTEVLSLAAAYNLSSPQLPVWTAALAALTGPVIDAASGTLSIYRGTPYDTPHRHYSHLFSIFPLRQLDFTNASAHGVAVRSINRWLATPEQDSMFYRPAASAMNVLLGQRAAAFDNITFLLHNRIEHNTFYREGAAGSCMETPYAAAWALADWLLQSWNTTAAVPGGAPIIDFFPAIDDVIVLDGSAYDAAPAKAAAASFYRLAASGGVLASAARFVRSLDAHELVTATSWVAVEASPAWARTPVVVRASLVRPLATVPAGVALTELGDGGLLLVDLASSPDGVVIYSATAPPGNPGVVTAAAGCPAQFNFWGAQLNATVPSAGDAVALRACNVDAKGRVSPSQRFAWNATAGSLALLDGSNRCLAVATCAGANGDAAVLRACSPPTNDAGAMPIGCDSDPCSTTAFMWKFTGQAGSPPGAFETATSGRCLDVNGAFNPNDIDVWDCDDPPGADKNQVWAFNSTSGALTSLDTNACCLNMCLTAV